MPLLMGVLDREPLRESLREPRPGLSRDNCGTEMLRMGEGELCLDAPLEPAPEPPSLRDRGTYAGGALGLSP